MMDLDKLIEEIGTCYCMPDCQGECKKVIEPVIKELYEKIEHLERENNKLRSVDQ